MKTLIKYAEENGYEYTIKISTSEQKFIQINIIGAVVEVKDHKKYYSVSTDTFYVRLAKQTEVVKYLKEVTEN